MAHFDLPQLYRTGRQQHYESFYIKANRPGGGQSIWIRYTLLRREDGTKSASTWFTHFNSELDGPQAFKQIFPADGFSLEKGESLLSIGDSAFSPDRLSGKTERDGIEATWDISIEEGREPFFYLPKEKMYEGAFPRTKFIAANPQTRFSGTVEIGGERIELDSWPGMVGHNWGTEHGRRWVWLNCNAFDGEDENTFFDGGAGRTRVGRWTAPWISSAIAVIRGQEYRFNSTASSLRGKVHETQNDCELILKGDDAEAVMRVSAPTKDFVGFLYQDPTGASRHTLNCSIANAELELRPKKGEAVKLKATGTAAYELGILPEESTAVPIEPFPDF